MFSLEILERDYDMTSPEGRTDFMKEAARKLTEFDEEIERNNYIDAVAGTYHVGSEDLKKTGRTNGSSDRTCKAGGKTEIYKESEPG